MNKPVIVFVYLLFLCYFFVRCSKDKDDFEDPKNTNRIELLIPGNEEVLLYSTATGNENYIRDCFVITFNSGGIYKNGEKIDISRIISNGNATALLPQLSFKTDLGDKVYVICNTGVTALPNGINTESDINDKFRPEKDYYFGGEALPMSGSTVWSNSTTVTLTRAVAKVQVELDEGFNVGGEGSAPPWDEYMQNFDESRCGFVIGNYGGKSDIIPPLSGLSQNLSGRSVFYGTTGENKFVRFVQHGNSEENMTVYISEYPNSIKDCEGNTITNDAFNDKRHFILMLDSVENGTSVVGNGGKANAWRLDFYDTLNKKYLDIKRNHHYRFIVRKIRSTPYIYTLSTNPGKIEDVFQRDQEVWHNPGSNIEYKVIVNEEWANYTYSNGQYGLSVSADTIKNADITFKIKAQIPSGVDHNQIKTHILNIYDRNGQPIGNTGSDLEVNGYPNASNGIAFPADGTETALTFTVNDEQYLDSAYMIIQLGNIYKKVMITLAGDWIYMPDPGFREYCNQKGFLSEIKASDNRYVKLSPEGEAADTITIQRVTVNYGISCSDVTVGLMSDIDISLYSKVADLTGLEAFTNLEYLYVGGNDITTIDVSSNTRLKVLSAYGSPVVSANLSNNKELFVIFFTWMFGNSMESLDISYCSPNMCFIGGRSKILYLTQEQKTSLGAGIIGLFSSQQIVPSPY